MKNALIIGPHSMLGKRLRLVLAAQGWAVHTAGRSEDCDIHLDLGAASLPAELPPIDAPFVFHCAASFRDDSWEGCRENELLNAVSGYLAAELCIRLASPQVVYAGSISSYIQADATRTSYGASKSRGEEILSWALSRGGVKFTSLRFAQLVDEQGECCRRQPWFGRIVAYMSSGLTLRLPPGQALRNYLHVEDAARMMIQAAEHSVEGIHPATSPSSITCYDLACLAREIFSSGGQIASAPEKTPFNDIYIPDSQNTLAALGLSHLLSPQDMLLLIKNNGTADRFGPKDVA
jgi:nucleoside-diphosphate-sugar epimerase